MIKEIKFTQYKKFVNNSICFKEGINAISGENGTCKSSLLYLISNSFQAVTPKNEWVKNKECLNIIKTVNTITNPKVESLQRGDQKYNNPAPNVPGTLYTVFYNDNYSLDFRRHNSNSNGKNRYALKPTYKSGTSEKLPFCPVIYLGLSRLASYGEFNNEEAISEIKKKLPDNYNDGIAENFREFTNYEIEYHSLQKMGDIKRRAEFVSKSEGVDSNTISSGEENLYIILSALESLKIYFESIETTRDIESILLIDELDATLHPDYQIRLLKLIRDYSSKYKIQVFFTTHSLTTLEDVLEHKDNLIYLVNNISHVTEMKDPSIQQIKAHLYNKTAEDIYSDKCIPIFTEDAEARVLIKLLFDYFQDTRNEFNKVRRFFSIPEINIGADILYGLFSDEKLIKSHVGAFCILDGDHNPNLTNCIITLPGKSGASKDNNLSPEKLLFNYSKILYDRDDNFWENQEVLRQGFGKAKYLRDIQNKIDKYESDFASKTTKKERRVFNKELFNANLKFFEYVFKRWLHDEDNEKIINKFYDNLKVMFLKCSELRGIDSSVWNDKGEE